MEDKKIELTQEEQMAIEPILEELSEQARFNISLERLLDKLRIFIKEVENGYDFSIYDYLNDLTIRDHVEKILRTAPSTLLEKLSREIQIVDQRFKDATVKLEKPLRKDNKEVSWWWYRIPRNPGEELRDDLKSEGIYWSWE